MSYPPGSSSLTQYFLATLNSTHRLGSVRHSRLLQPLDELLASWLRHLFPLSLELQLHLWNHLDMLLLALQFDDRLLSYLLVSSSLIEYLLVDLNSTHRLGSIRHSTLLQSLDELLVSWLRRPYPPSLELQLHPWNHLDMLLLTLQFGGRLLLYPLASSNLIGYPLVDLYSTHQLASIRHSTLLQPLDELSVSWLRRPYLLSLELQLHLWNHLDMLLLALQLDDRLLSYLLASSSLIGYLLVDLNSTHQLGSIPCSTLLQGLDELLVSWLRRPYLLSLGLSLRLWSHLGTLLLALQFDVQLLTYLLVSSSLVGYLLVKLQLESIHRLALASRLMKHLILP